MMSSAGSGGGLALLDYGEAAAGSPEGSVWTRSAASLNSITRSSADIAGGPEASGEGLTGQLALPSGSCTSAG